MDFFNSNSMNLLNGAIGAAVLRQQVISNNIANVDTPNFKRSDVLFEDLLQNQMQSQSFAGFHPDSRHFVFSSGNAPLQSKIVVDQQSVMNNNKNNVDIDREMTTLAQNQLRYNVMIEQMNNDLKNFRIAIEGR
ncbi:MAG: flagellar basal-body rod protein FlgB [Paenibacillus sp. RIFOXYA1_FULL_44_5]|nr:MAG: flagellar basal-body rod protein FlgB [Paenibacillus sp. RIFOXYA1_FULL_44_5]